MSRYQDIYDELADGQNRARIAKEAAMAHIAELNIEIEAVEQAMDREDFRIRWERLKAIVERLSHERENLLRKL